MKVKIEFTVDIDAETWDLIYGTGLAGVREDVKDYAWHVVTETMRENGVLA